MTEKKEDFVYVGVSNEHAKRMQACWNFCTGLDTAALEAMQGGAGEMRDELKHLVDLASYHAMPTAFNTARAILAKLEGKV